MSALCQTRIVDGECASSTPKLNFNILAVVQVIRNFIDERKGSTMKMSVPTLQRNMEKGRIQAAQKYMTARLAGKHEDVLRLVTDDIQLESSRDGRVVGKKQFKAYLQKAKPTGTWEAARWNYAIGKAEIRGRVKILMVRVGVIAHFGFDRHGKINQIYVGTQRRANKLQSNR